MFTRSITHMWLHGDAEGGGQEEREHPARSRGPRVGNGWLHHRNARELRIREQSDLGRPAGRLQREGHGRTHGQQRRGDDHQQQVLDHVGLEVVHRERGHRRLEGQVDHHQPGQERGRAPAAPRPTPGSTAPTTDCTYQAPTAITVTSVRRAKGPVSHWVTTLWSGERRARVSPTIPGSRAGLGPGRHGDTDYRAGPVAPIRRPGPGRRRSDRPTSAPGGPTATG